MPHEPFDGSELRTASAAMDPAGPPSPRLHAFWPGGSASFALPDSGSLTIGRSKGCDIVIDHASVSRQHAVLVAGASPRIKDLGSSNGSLLSGQRLPANVPTIWPSGALLEIGKVMLVLQLPAASREPESAHGTGAPMERVQKLIALVAPSLLTVLVVGETGVGKDVTVEALHRRSARNGPLVRVNCAALAPSLLESELFGHEKGAFTGAVSAKVGLIEAAEGGTLFLDEVAELPAELQAKLLIVLERREVTRVGSATPRRVDVRFVAATNRPLGPLVQRGVMREDFYFRLNGVTIAIPPLRERVDEIPRLAREIVAEACRSAGRTSLDVSDAALELLARQPFPGNVRELKTLLERAVLVCEGSAIQPGDLALAQQLGGAERAHGPVARPVPRDDDVERRRVLDALAQCAGNQTRAAAMLGIARRTLITKLEIYGIERPRKPRRH